MQLEVLATARDKVALRIKEAQLIKQLQPDLNCREEMMIWNRYLL